MTGKKFPIEPEAISVRIGKSYVGKLRDYAFQESVKRNMPITPTDVVKEALKKMHPELFL